MSVFVVWVAFGLGFLLYAGAFGYLLSRFFAQKTANTVGVLTLFLVASVCHAWVLLPSIITKFGLNFNLFNSLSLSALFFVVFFVVFCLYRPIVNLGILTAPTALLGLTAGFFGRASYEPLADIGTALEIHIILSFAAYCVLLMACVQAIILSLQIKELKHQTRHRLWVTQLPPLQTMEHLLFDMILLGFVLLTIALSVGFLSTYDIKAQHIAHKLVFSVLSWLVFGGLIVGHYRYGWQGRRACRITIYGFLLLAIGFIGTKVVLEVLLNS